MAEGGRRACGRAARHCARAGLGRDGSKLTFYLALRAREQSGRRRGRRPDTLFYHFPLFVISALPPCRAPRPSASSLLRLARRRAPLRRVLGARPRWVVLWPAVARASGARSSEGVGHDAVERAVGRGVDVAPRFLVGVAPRSRSTDSQRTPAAPPRVSTATADAPSRVAPPARRRGRPRGTSRSSSRRLCSVMGVSKSAWSSHVLQPVHHAF